jgi:hypothetical protein
VLMTIARRDGNLGEIIFSLAIALPTPVQAHLHSVAIARIVWSSP